MRRPARLIHPMGAELGETRVKDVARDGCQIVQADDAGSRHAVVGGEGNFSVETPYPCRDVVEVTRSRLVP